MEAEQILGDRYRLDWKIGEGGMSVVWHARDQVLGRPVAVKVLAAAYASDAASRRRIRAEAQVAARLSHPHVTAVYDYGESMDEDGNRVPYIVMELLPGQTLAERLAGGPLPPRVALRVCAEVASALAEAHAHGLVHRDVKPANVVLTPDGAKVVDFGIAAAVGQPEELDLDSPVFGTPAYLAPERLTGDEVVAASDVYALGLLLYRVLTDKLPWRVETATQMVVAHAYVEPAPLPPVPGLPPEVAALYRQCVAKDPDDRPTAAGVATTLARLAGIQPRADDEDSAVRVPQPPPSVRPRRVSVIAMVALVVTALAASAFALSGSIGDAGPVKAPPGPAGEASANGLGRIDPAAPAPSASPTPVAPTPQSVGPAGPGTAPGTTTTSPAPGDATPSHTASPPPPPPAAVTRTLTSEGGSVVATCRQTMAELLSVDPAPGYVVKSANYGPATQVGVVFKGSTAIRMSITCRNGEPTVIH